MADNDSKGMFHYISPLTAVVVMSLALIAVQVREYYEETATTLQDVEPALNASYKDDSISLRAKPRIFATTMDGSTDSIEPNTIGVVTSSYFFVMKHVGKGMFQMNNIRNDTDVVIKVGSGHTPFEEFKPGELRHGHGVPVSDRMYQYMVQVEQAGAGVILNRCVMNAPVHTQSNGMTVICY